MLRFISCKTEKESRPRGGGGVGYQQDPTSPIGLLAWPSPFCQRTIAGSRALSELFVSCQLKAAGGGGV